MLAMFVLVNWGICQQWEYVFDLGLDTLVSAHTQRAVLQSNRTPVSQQAA